MPEDQREELTVCLPYFPSPGAPVMRPVIRVTSLVTWLRGICVQPGVHPHFWADQVSYMSAWMQPVLWDFSLFKEMVLSPSSFHKSSQMMLIIGQNWASSKVIVMSWCLKNFVCEFSHSGNIANEKTAFEKTTLFYKIWPRRWETQKGCLLGQCWILTRSGVLLYRVLHSRWVC